MPYYSIVCVYDEGSSIISAVLEYSLHFRMKKKMFTNLGITSNFSQKDLEMRATDEH